jgi:hypothetical protein
MRRFVNEALVRLNALSEHVTAWMAEGPDPREGDADKLTARQWVLVHAGYIKGALEAGLAAADVTDPSASLAAAVGHVRDLEGQLDLVDARMSAAEKRASEAMRDRDTAIEQRDLARSAVHGYRESCDEVHRLLTAAGVTGEDDATAPVRVQRLIAERDGLRDKTRSQSSAAPAADRNAIGIDHAATCGECSKYRSDGYCADIDACVGGGDDVCGSFTRRMPETPAAAATCGECGNLFAGECVAMKCGPRYKHDPVCPCFVRRGEEVQP